MNYPTTEYLDLSFLDFDCFNVYLENPQKLSSYLARLHNLTGDRPLVLAEIGLDSHRNGIDKQAEILSWQIETTFAKGCAGLFVFAWTDEWWRGGYEIEDWDFGLVDRKRIPKLALNAVSEAFSNVPFHPKTKWPSITVTVCSYNGSATIRECLEGILNLEYPNYNVLVVDDGSKDGLAEIVKEYPVKLISTPNCGLSAARNTGMNHATGEIIAYIDDDAYPDPHWLHYLAYGYLNTEHACIGGPNIAPYDSKFISTCVANAPGGPVHVLETDEIAEHVPGCNMSFRRKDLLNIGGFDPVFRSAGDDVDVCWRIQKSGKTIGFHPSAVVWHHRRNSFKAYWKQQQGYGKAEALLEAKWPEKYNSLGHYSWSGRIYGNGFTMPIKTKKDKIFHGSWGTALFQSVYQAQGSYLNFIPLMPEWYLFTTFFLLLACAGFMWTPLLWMWPVFAAAIGIIVVQAVKSAVTNSALQPAQRKNIKYTGFIVLLHMIQPVARLYGRIKNGLTPWRNRGADASPKFILSIFSKVFTHWSEKWHSTEEWLLAIEKNLLEQKARIQRGNHFDRWDLQVLNGLFTRTRGLLTIEEHGAGKQYLRFKCTPYYKLKGILIPVFLMIGLALSLSSQLYLLSITLGAILVYIGIQFTLETSRSMNSFYQSIKQLGESLQTERPVETIGEKLADMDLVPNLELNGDRSNERKKPRFIFARRNKRLQKYSIKVETEEIEENVD